MFIKITNAMIFKVLFEPNNILNLQWISADVLKNNSLCKKNVGFFKFFNVQSGLKIHWEPAQYIFLKRNIVFHLLDRLPRSRLPILTVVYKS